MPGSDDSYKERTRGEETPSPDADLEGFIDDVF